MSDRIKLKTALGLEANLPDGFPNNYRGQMQLTTDTTLAFAAIDTYEKIAGVWTDSCLFKFTFDATGILTYTGPYACFLFNGVSDLQVDKACNVSFALYKNGALVTGAETPHTFTSAAKTSNISITRICTLETGDTIEVYAKSDDDTATATIKSLSITLWK
jgi:hypothetical protein